MSALLNALTKPSVTNQPPTRDDLRRADIAVILAVIFALFLGYGIRNNALYNSRTVSLGDGLPSLEVPANWITGQPEGMIFSISNPRSAGVFDTTISAMTRALGPQENANTARAALAVQRTQALLRYRELDAQRATIAGSAGLVITYAYVDDPTRDQGAVAPPVVVQAQDFIFARDGQAIIVTFATDAAHWETQASTLELLESSLNVQLLPTEIPGDE
jgi:hypothetical protein